MRHTSGFFDASNSSCPGIVAVMLCIFFFDLSFFKFRLPFASSFVTLSFSIFRFQVSDQQTSPAPRSSADPYGFDQTGALQGTGGFAIILSSDTVASTQSMWSAHTKWHRRWMDAWWKIENLETVVFTKWCWVLMEDDQKKVCLRKQQQ